MVWNNYGYGEIENYVISNEIAPIGVRPSPMDFRKFADAYGLAAVRVSDIVHLPKEIANALKTKRSSLLRKERWSRKFGPIVKVDRMTKEVI